MVGGDGTWTADHLRRPGAVIRRTPEGRDEPYIPARDQRADPPDARGTPRAQ
jgi:hypothetical protein